MKPAHELDPQPEKAWFNRSLDELAELRGRVLDAGYSVAFTNSLIGFLVGGDSTSMSTRTRADYRKVLRELAPDGPTRRRRGRRIAHQHGFTSMELAAAGAATGPLALVAHQTGSVALYAVASALVPIILDEPGFVEQTPTPPLSGLAVAA